MVSASLSWKMIRRRGGSPPCAQADHPRLSRNFGGDDPASQVYVRSKQRKARELGLLGANHLTGHGAQAEVAAVIDAYNHDERIHAILVNRHCRRIWMNKR